MALALRFTCNRCGHAVEAWSDGNPYYLDGAGAKHYAYHPDHENLARCVGNDEPHLCLACGAECVVDSREPISACPACGAKELTDTCELAGRPCPYCKGGTFAEDPDCFAIS